VSIRYRKHLRHVPRCHYFRVATVIAVLCLLAGCQTSEEQAQSACSWAKADAWQQCMLNQQAYQEQRRAASMQQLTTGLQILAAPTPAQYQRPTFRDRTPTGMMCY
jgi:hypothetical protein